MLTPRLLVVIPTLGTRLDFLAGALESCRELSSLVPLRICVVVPPGATEARTLGAAAGATIVDDPGSGMADAVNAALGTTESEDYYVWLGDDDVLLPAGVSALVATLDNDGECVLAYGGCEYVDGLGRSIMTTRAGNLARLMLAWGPNFIPHPGTVIRISALREVGLFTSGLSYALDLDMFLRLRRVGSLRPVRVTASRFRWHHESLTVASRSKSSQEAIYVKKLSLPHWLRPLSGLWNVPVMWLSSLAAAALNARAARLARGGERP